MVKSQVGPDIIQAIKDPRLIGDTISPGQEMALRGMYGLPLPTEKIDTKVFHLVTCPSCKGKRERNGKPCKRCRTLGHIPKFKIIKESPLQLYRRATTRRTYVAEEFLEAGLYIGARGGKSDKLAGNIAIYEGTLRRHKLSVGEWAYIPVIAFDKKQAQIVYRYILGKLQRSPTLSSLINATRAEEIELKNNVIIGVYPCSFRQLRGYSIPCAILDEVAVWRDEDSNANPAIEVIRAIRRGMATFENAKLVKISTPFAKSGIVWEEWKNRDKLKHVFIWKNPCWQMNPSVNESFLLSEFYRDQDNFEREFGAEFWESAAALLPAERVDMCVAKGVKERFYDSRFNYVAVIDVAWKRDNFAFSIFHKEGNKAACDLVRAWEGSPKNPVKMRETVKEIAGTVRSYATSIVHGDQFCSEPIRQAFAELGVEYRQYTMTQVSKEAMYATLRTLVMSNNAEFTDDLPTIAELKSLEARTGTHGSIKVSAPPGGKDDRATVIALGAHICVEVQSNATTWIKAFSQIASQSRGRPQHGRTMCSDCGRTIPLGESYIGLGAGIGQCMACKEKHGAPTYGAVKPKESAPRLIPDAVVEEAK